MSELFGFRTRVFPMRGDAVSATPLGQTGVVMLAIVLAASSARAELEPPLVTPPSDRALHAILIGVSGAAVAGAYTAGAFATGDQPSARPLALTGGILMGGLAGATVGLALGVTRDDPGSMLTYLLRPLLGGLIGAALGGVLSGFGAWEPGTTRTVTHAVIIGLVLTETVVLEFARLSKF